MKKRNPILNSLFICIFLIFNGMSFTFASFINDNYNDEMEMISLFSGNKGKVVGFTLIDAEKNIDLFKIKDGDKINLKELGIKHINIRANTDPSQLGSVVFDLTGEIILKHIENVAPYALYANDKNNYFKWTPKPGSYKLTATPFTKEGGAGEAGEDLTINFQVINETQVTGFVLINADNNKDIVEITEGMEIDIKKLPTQNINIRAITFPEEVGSVEISITDLIGGNFYSHVENAVPYALFSDQNGDYYGRFAENGSFRLRGIPYKLNNARGQQGYALSRSFKMINGEDFSSSKLLKSDIILESSAIFPNPGKNSLNIFLENPQSKTVQIQLLDLMGNEVLLIDKKTNDKSINLMLDVSGLENKPYIIKLTSKESVQSYRWIKE